MPPFLEILTRCYKRPRMLAVNHESLRQQAVNSWWLQTFLVDDVGQGIGWSYVNMAAYAPKLKGNFIWILDDDDMCICPTFIEDLEEIAAAHHPDVIMVKMDHGPRGILPRLSWQKRPALGDIGCSAFVVQREVWQAHAPYFPADYNGDYAFIASIFDEDDYEIYWYDCIASQVQQISNGRPESKLGRERRVPNARQR